MKKLLLLLLVLTLVVSLATSCSMLDSIFGSTEEEGDPESYKYTEFTNGEKSLFNTYIGFVIPFIPNDEYRVEGYNSPNDFESGINYYTFGNSAEEFEAYKELYASYTLDRTEVDEYENTKYFYVKDGVEVSLSYYYSAGASFVDVYVRVLEPDDDGNGDGTPDGDTPDDDTPGGDTPGSDTPGGDTPDGDTPGGDTPDGDTPDGDTPDGDTPDEGDDDPSSGTHRFTDFKSDEKALFTDHFGFVIPFLPNSEYALEEGEDELGYYIYFYTLGNTTEEFNAYLSALSAAYTFEESYVDDYGDTCYIYSHGDVYIDISFYETEDGQCVDAFIYKDTEGGDSSDDGNPDDGNQGSDTDHLYTSFTSTEKALFNEHFGFVIPFLPNSDYALEELEDEYGVLLNFYTFGNTESEYNAYRSILASTYTFVESYVDDYGDTCYAYSRGDIIIDITYYESDEDGWCVDVYIYEDVDTGADDNNDVDDDNDVDVITNEGAGLPTPSGDSGHYDVDLSAGNVTNVTEQGYYIDGCPTTGRPGVLVIPVEFSDATAASKGYTVDAIKNAFLPGGETDYFSVYDYYLASSYGKLELDVTVYDGWFRPQFTSDYYQNRTIDYFGDETAIGDQLILDEALKYLEDKIDLSEFDSDSNGIIDAVVLINTLDINYDETFYWAYRYWNIYTDEDDHYYEYDGVSANDYLWASYQFLHESRDSIGNVIYTDTEAMNTYTFIHEFGHILGADDYYDTAYIGDGLHGLDMMDATAGDHNPYTKFNLGWVSSTRLIITLTETTLDLYAFGETGDTIILANDWSNELGVYQEYYVIMYYRNTGLNTGTLAGYFDEEGIVVYRVDASLYGESNNGTVYYDVYNNNTDSSDPAGTERNLIELIESGDGDFLFEMGESLPDDLTDWGGDALGYTFTVGEVSEDYATITFTKLTA